MVGSAAEKHEHWIEISLRLDGEAGVVAEAAAGLVGEVCAGIEERAGNDGSPVIVGYVPGTNGNAQRVQELQRGLERLEAINGLARGSLIHRLEIRAFQESNWAETWKQFYQPIRIGQHVVVYPSWESPGDIREEDLPILLDPGQAFGTGHHESSRLCLVLMEDLPLENRRVADVGCGSGILAIGAALLGAGEVWACDTDTLAVEAARQNVAGNQVESSVRTVEGSVEAIRSKGPFDLVCANILASILDPLGAALAEITAQGGRLIWSGIMVHQLPWMRKVCSRESLLITRVVRENDWAALLIKRTD